MSASFATLPRLADRNIGRPVFARMVAAAFYALVASSPVLEYLYVKLGFVGSATPPYAGLALNAYRSWGGLYLGCAALCGVLLFRRSALATWVAAVVTCWYATGWAVRAWAWLHDTSPSGRDLALSGAWLCVYAAVFVLVLRLRVRGALK